MEEMKQLESMYLELSENLKEKKINELGTIELGKIRKDYEALHHLNRELKNKLRFDDTLDTADYDEISKKSDEIWDYVRRDLPEVINIQSEKLKLGKEKLHERREISFQRSRCKETIDALRKELETFENNYKIAGNPDLKKIYEKPIKVLKSSIADEEKLYEKYTKNINQLNEDIDRLRNGGLLKAEIDKNKRAAARKKALEEKKKLEEEKIKAAAEEARKRKKAQDEAKAEAEAKSKAEAEAKAKAEAEEKAKAEAEAKAKAEAEEKAKAEAEAKAKAEAEEKAKAEAEEKAKAEAEEKAKAEAEEKAASAKKEKEESHSSGEEKEDFKKTKKKTGIMPKIKGKRPDLTWKSVASIAAGVGLGRLVFVEFGPLGIVASSLASIAGKKIINKKLEEIRLNKLNGVEEIASVSDPTPGLKGKINNFKNYLKTEEGLKNLSWMLNASLISGIGFEAAAFAKTCIPVSHINLEAQPAPNDILSSQYTNGGAGLRR